MRSSAAFAFAVACAALPSGPAAAHDLRYKLTEANAVVVGLHYADDNRFSFESYEVYRQGQDVPYQVGRTDARGQVVFVPDAPGAWRVKVFSEDGHGLDIALETGPGWTLAGAERPLFERYARVLVGVGVLLGIFGAISLFYRRRRP